MIMAMRLGTPAETANYVEIFYLATFLFAKK